MVNLTPSEVKGSTWSSSDTEEVRCCICDAAGVLLYDLDPFGVIKCPQCGLVFVSPRLTSGALQQLYDNPAYFQDRVYGAKPWSPSSLLQRTWTNGRLNAIDRNLNRPLAGATMLEIGCGFGHFLASAHLRGMQVSGVELSHAGAAYAHDELGLTIHEGQLEDASFDRPFDVICAWDTIEHVPDPVRFLRSVRNHLADDGLVAFSTPYFSSFPSRLLRTRWWTLKPTEHIWHFTPETHAAALARAGLGLVQVVRNPLAATNFGRLDSLVGIARKLPDTVD